MTKWFRYRPKVVFGKGVGKSKNASEVRQKCVRNASKMRQMGLDLLGREERSKMRQKCVKIASKMRQKCAEHLGGQHLLDGTVGQQLGCTIADNCARVADSVLKPPSAIGSAIGRPLSRPVSHPRAGRSSQLPCSKPLRGLNRAIVAFSCRKPLQNKREAKTR